ncbi:CAP domain-containing protein [Streptomyces qinglanensis]|uniref:Uncharacterized conserved protein YkwD, contains CAP (CSP/antigen 5/PR1) domain n=1 Tax=Streptomyces qinglanensis TaxID=943816 RepID=A0A1H9VSZ1_9ACTN|nr:CAP domain-containing protein [Streptomyces qinglanensis]SES24659.1 Uncharacterized conserved protein YkwD, contains CAP (CSP/antigen 5/PR1) domain [Streptomyces qinglanensis]
MGRHRRATPTPAVPPESSEPQAVHPHRGGRRRRRAGTPVRTGVLGASAALAMGTVAVASGLIPAPGGLGGPRDSRVQADGTGPAVPPVSATPTDLDSTAPPGDADKSPSPSPTPSRKSEPPSGKPTASPSKQASKTPEPTREEEHGSRAGSSRPDPGGSGGGSTAAADQESAAESEILALVNQERAKAGCKPLTADAELAALAGDYSEDMARRGYFSHTSPDGKSPWDRAEAAGVSDLGGENIARGQANARSVMDSWMNSPGHRANILNCDYRTLGVGAHFAEGGPWWTQDFGF